MSSGDCDDVSTVDKEQDRTEHASLWDAACQWPTSRQSTVEMLVVEADVDLSHTTELGFACMGRLDPISLINTRNIMPAFITSVLGKVTTYLGDPKPGHNKKKSKLPS